MARLRPAALVAGDQIIAFAFEQSGKRQCRNGAAPRPAVERPDETASWPQRASRNPGKRQTARSFGWRSLREIRAAPARDRNTRANESHKRPSCRCWSSPRTQNRYPHTSAQSVQLARALAHPMRLLILDEPFTGLDAANRAHFHVVLERLMATPLRVLLIATRIEDLPRHVTHLLF